MKEGLHPATESETMRFVTTHKVHFYEYPSKDNPAPHPPGLILHDADKLLDVGMCWQLVHTDTYAMHYCVYFVWHWEPRPTPELIK